jgi:hypothetical protein
MDPILQNDLGQMFPFYTVASFWHAERQSHFTQLAIAKL